MVRSSDDYDYVEGWLVRFQPWPTPSSEELVEEIRERVRVVEQWRTHVEHALRARKLPTWERDPVLSRLLLKHFVDHPAEIGQELHYAMKSELLLHDATGALLLLAGTGDFATVDMWLGPNFPFAECCDRLVNAYEALVDVLLRSESRHGPLHAN